MNESSVGSNPTPSATLWRGRQMAGEAPELKGLDSVLRSIMVGNSTAGQQSGFSVTLAREADGRARRGAKWADVFVICPAVVGSTTEFDILLPGVAWSPLCEGGWGDFRNTDKNRDPSFHSGRQKSIGCHSESFGKLRINSVKNLGFSPPFSEELVLSLSKEG